jgi:hypothetical protein
MLLERHIQTSERSDHFDTNGESDTCLSSGDRVPATERRKCILECMAPPDKP